AVERRRNADPAADYGEDSENDERDKHDPRALVDMVVIVAVVRVAVTARPAIQHRCRGRTGMSGGVVFYGLKAAGAALSKEREVPEPEHVERSQERGEEADRPENLAAVWREEGFVEDFVLAEESGEGRNTGDGEDCGGHGPEGNGKLLAKATHDAHVLLATNGVNHGASGEEEQGLEKGVRNKVEDSGGVRGDSAGQKHVAKLGDGRVGQHALDIRLDDTDGCGEECGGHSDDGHDGQREG